MSIKEKTDKYELNVNTKKVIASRYSAKDENGNATETWADIVERVVKEMARAETNENKKQKFYNEAKDLMLSRKLICNTPGLVNAGRNAFGYAACYVIDVEDSLESIMQHAANAAKIHQQSGGVGQSYGKLRPAQSAVKSTQGIASGPVSFMGILDNNTNIVKQGGCVIGSTLVMTEHGPTKIIDLKEGTLVYAWDGKYVLRRATAAWKTKEKAEVWKLLTDNGLIVYATPDHKFLLKKSEDLGDKFYTPLQDLELNTEIISFGNYITSKVMSLGYSHYEDVYDIEVEDAHNFVVCDENGNGVSISNSRRGANMGIMPCVTGDTLVYTDKGLLTVKDLVDKKIEVSVAVDSRFGKEEQFTPAKKFFYTGDKETFLLTTKEGYELNATADHRIMTSRGWVELQNLKAGDKIHLLNSGGGFGEAGYTSLGRLAGWILMESEIVDYAANKIKLNFFNGKGNVKEIIKKDVVLASSASGFVSTSGGQAVLTKEEADSFVLHEDIIRSMSLYAMSVKSRNNWSDRILGFSKGTQKGFLQALFSSSKTNILDAAEYGGSFTPESYVSVKFDSVGLAKNVQLMLLNFGIVSNRFLTNIGLAGKNIVNFLNEIGFIDNNLTKETEKLIRQNENLSNVDFVATVDAIEPTGVKPVYDTTVNGVSAFVANGMVVHNCTHPDVLRFIHAKNDQTSLTNFNISVTLTDIFMNAVENEEWFQTSFDGKDWDRAVFDPVTGTDYVLYVKKGLDLVCYNAETFVDKQDFESKRLDLNEQTIKPPKPGMIYAPDIWNRIAASAWKYAEPGIAFIDEVNRHNYLKNSMGEITACNPCLVGETLVAVADGRGHVSIKQLAEEGKDVPVYTLNDKGHVSVRTMRNPRITGNEKVYKLTLDDGNTIRATANHKFKLKDSQYKALEELLPGDSLELLTKFHASLKDIFPTCNSNSQDYIWLKGGSRNNPQAEHRLIASFEQNTQIPNGYIVHHIDYNAKNNRPDNLRIMTKADHDELHSKDMIGDNNPMRRAKIEWSEEKWADYRAKQSKANSGEKNRNFSGISNETIKKHAILLTKQIGRRFSAKEWQNYALERKLPSQFSKWRNDHFGGILGFAKWAALELGLEHVDEDPRVLATYNRMSSEGYNCEIVDGEVLISKLCEFCKKEFKVPHLQREAGVCSTSCHSKLFHKNNPHLSGHNNPKIRAKAEARMEAVRKKQIQVYLDCKTKSVSGDVQKKDWIAACKKAGVSFEISRTSSPFRDFAALKEAASMFNHKVVSVEEDGYETVYNGTVDEFHNFFVGGFESLTQNNKTKFFYINNLQCGEQWLHSSNSCNLASIDVSKFYNIDLDDLDWTELTHAIRVGVRFLDNVIDVCPWPLPAIEDVVKRTRPIGLGVMGFADLLIKKKIRYGSEESLKYIEDFNERFLRDSWLYSIELGREKGVFPEYKKNKEAYDEYLYKVTGLTYVTPRNYETTMSAPTGSISLLAECSSGIEPNISWAYVREDTIGVRTYVHPLAAEALGVIYDPNDSDSTLKAAQEVCNREHELPSYFVDAYDVSAEQHVKVLAAFQKYTSNACSKSVNAPKDHTVQDVKNLYWLAYKLGTKCVSYYRDGSREGQVLTKMTQTAKEKVSESSSDENTVNIIPEKSQDLQKIEQIEKELDSLKRAAPVIKAIRIDRPKELLGYTWAIPFDGSNLFVTVNHNNEKILEVFAFGPISPSVGLLASKMLRGGFEVEELIRTLAKVTGTHSSWFNQHCCTSPEQAIAECLLITKRRLNDSINNNTLYPQYIPLPDEVAEVEDTERIENIKNTEKIENKSVQKPKSKSQYIKVCPECSGQLELTGGCFCCRDCSYSKCS